MAGSSEFPSSGPNIGWPTAENTFVPDSTSVPIPTAPVPMGRVSSALSQSLAEGGHSLSHMPTVVQQSSSPALERSTSFVPSVPSSHPDFFYGSTPMIGSPWPYLVRRYSIDKPRDGDHQVFLLFLPSYWQISEMLLL